VTTAIIISQRKPSPVVTTALGMLWLMAMAVVA